MYRFGLSLALYFFGFSSFASTVPDMPMIDLSLVSDVTGVYEVSFNAPANTPENYEYRLHESSDSGSTWTFVLRASRQSGDLPPFTKLLTNRSNGTYQYRANVCLIDTAICSAHSAIESIVISENPTDNYGLEFDGIDDHVALNDHYPITISGPAEIKFKWTYQGPGKNYLLSFLNPTSPLQNKDHLYISDAGLGFNLNGVDEQWSFDATGTHTYVLSLEGNGVSTLSVDGVSLGSITFEKADPIQNFRTIGAAPEGRFGRGIIHWLKIEYPHGHRDYSGNYSYLQGWNFLFEDDSDIIRDEWSRSNRSFVMSQAETRWHNFVLPSSKDIRAPKILSFSAVDDTFSVVFEAESIPETHEYRLYESSDNGVQWHLISTVEKVAGDSSSIVKNITKENDEVYSYRAIRCVKGTASCSPESNTVTVMAFATILEPVLTAPTISDLSGSYDIQLNAPLSVADDYEYRVFESSDLGVNWQQIDSKSRANADQLPFVTSVSNRPRGVYHYQAMICSAGACSLNSNPISVVVSKLALIEDSYALKFDEGGDSVTLHYPISITGLGDLEVRWTYQGPGKNYILSHASGALLPGYSPNHIYLIETGLGIQISGVDFQWDFDVSGTHTYMLRFGNDGAITLFVDGVSMGAKNLSPEHPIQRFTSIGSNAGAIGKGLIHWLKITASGEKRYFRFEDNASRIEDAWNSSKPGLISPTGVGNWIDVGSQKSTELLYPPVMRNGELQHTDTNISTYDIRFETDENTRTNYEYNLYESRDNGSSWHLIEARVPTVFELATGSVLFSLTGREGKRYRYKGNLCVEGTNHCTDFSKQVEFVNTSYLIPSTPELYTPAMSASSARAPCFSWENLGDNVTYDIYISEDPGHVETSGYHFFTSGYALKDLQGTEACWNTNWSRFEPKVNGSTNTVIVDEVSPTLLESGKLYFWHVWSRDTDSGYYSERHSPQRVFFTEGLEAPELSAPRVSDGARFDVHFNAPENVASNHEYRMYESSDGGESWNYTGRISTALGDEPPFKGVYRDMSEGVYLYKAKVCVIYTENSEHCSGDSNTVSVSVVEKIVSPVLSAPLIASKERYEVDLNAPVDIPVNYEYQLYRSENYGASWDYLGFLSKAVGVMPPYKSVHRDNSIGTYQYKAKICLNDVGTEEVCSKFSDVVTVSVTESLAIPAVIYIHTDLLGSPVAESDEQGRVK